MTKTRSYLIEGGQVALAIGLLYGFATTGNSAFRYLFLLQIIVGILLISAACAGMFFSEPEQIKKVTDHLKTRKYMPWVMRLIQLGLFATCVYLHEFLLSSLLIAETLLGFAFLFIVKTLQEHIDENSPERISDEILTAMTKHAQSLRAAAERKQTLQ